MKRWRVEPQDLWLIFTRRGVDIRKYPAIHDHLKQFKRALTPGVPGGRKPGPYEWYEIQDNIAYWREFENQKIIYPDIYEHQSFAFDVHGFFSVNTTYFLPTEQKWLVGLLNSMAVEWFYALVSNSVRGGYLRAFSDYMSNIPIPLCAGAQQKEVDQLVEQIMAQKKADADADVSALEREIDERVYRLYGLTKDEIKIVEEGAR